MNSPTLETENAVDNPIEKTPGERMFRSPNRILVRSFRLSRNKWKQKHHETQAKLRTSRQLAADRGAARDHWRTQCEAAETRAQAAEALAAQQRSELEQAQARVAELEACGQKKTR